ncbi:MAG: PAS domain-containing sensor histidine kinase [Methanospirillaceae archaeon]|nr:PAS domain-containing sensor histidine kinase [Methanospirillaceae archaeon]
MTPNDDNKPFEIISHAAERKVALRNQAEEQALAMEQVTLSPQTPEEIQRVLHELRVHQIELEMQNEELRTAQARIEAGRVRYFDLYDLAPVGYCTVSEQGLFLEANLTAATLLNMARSDLVKQPISRFILEEDQDIYYLHRRQLFLTGEPQECELRLAKPDGTLIWSHLTATVAQTEDGVPVCRVVLSDITERKRAEEALRLFRDLVEHSSDAIGMSTPEGRHYFQNEAFNRLFGNIGEYPPDRMYVDKAIGKHVFETIQGGGSWQGEVNMFKADRTNLDIFLRAFAIKDQEGRVIGLVGLHTDITEHKRMEEALKASEMRFKKILQNVDSVAVQGYALDGTVRYWNHASETFYGYSAKEALGRNMLDLIIPPDRGNGVKADIRHMVETGESIPAGELELIRKDGSYISVYSSHALVEVQGQEPELFCIDVDITDRKATEQALHITNRKLQLLSNITRHDIQNKIMALQGYLDLAIDETHDPTLSGYLNKAEMAANAIQKQIEFTKVYEELGVHTPAWQQVPDIIRAIDDSSIPIRHDCNDISIFADPMFEKVLSNLYDNTIRHADGAETVTIGCEKQDGNLLIIWEDNGTGVPDDQKELIFEKGVGKNTGLGLFLVREILSITGISIRETGEQGKGARFEITVPEGKWRMSG